MSNYELGSVRVLVVDDDPDVRVFVSHVLKAAGCEVQVAADGEQAVIAAFDFRADIVFLDITIPFQCGWLVCAKLKLIEPSPTVVLITGLDRDYLSNFSEFVKADSLLRKPFSAKDVLELIPGLPV